MSLVSIIVPIYNVERYINDCVKSLLKQTYNNIEIILVDDGSTDMSGMICDNLKSNDNRIKVIHKRNGGLSDARNEGINIASGKYLTFIDSDDVVEIDFVEYLYNLLIENDAEMSVCHYRKIDEQGNIISETIKDNDELVIGNNSCMEKFFKGNDIGTVAWGKLYKTELFRKIRYPVGKYHEDVFTTYKVVALCDKIAIGAKAKYLYRLRHNSIVNQEVSLKHLDAVEANIERSQFILATYPKLYDYACAGIIYAANQCVMKLIQTKKNYPIQVSYLKCLYKNYSKYYLKITHSKLKKLFVRFAKLNLSLFIKICKPFRGFLNEYKGR